MITGDGWGWAHLNARGDAVDDPDGFAVWVARQRVGDEMVLHLPWRLSACFHPINGLTGWTLQTAILRRQGQYNQTGKTLLVMTSHPTPKGTIDKGPGGQNTPKWVTDHSCPRLPRLFLLSPKRQEANSTNSPVPHTKGHVRETLSLREGPGFALHLRAVGGCVCVCARTQRVWLLWWKGTLFHSRDCEVLSEQKRTWTVNSIPRFPRRNGMKRRKEWVHREYVCKKCCYTAGTKALQDTCVSLGRQESSVELFRDISIRALLI